MLKKKLNKWLYENVIKLIRKQAKVTLHTIKVEEHNIAYLESNSENKKTLILIHGMNDEKESWLMLAGALKGKYHLIIIDLLGCGESSLPMEFNYSLSSQANFLQKVIEKMMIEKNIKSFFLAGHSMGGLIVFLTNKLPIEKLILIDTLGVHVKLTQMQIDAQKVDDIDTLSFLNLTNKKQLKELLHDVYHKVPYMPSFVLEHIIEKKIPINAFEKKKFKYIVNENMLHIDDLTSLLKEIKQETLIVWGNEDMSIDVASAYKFDELIENSHLKIYKKCRHYPQLEKPKELAKDIVEFLG